MRISRLLAFPLLTAAALSAQPAPRPRTLTLQQAIALAQEKGPQAELARSVRDAAQFRDQAFNSRLLPQLLASGNLANLNHGINAITLPDGSTQFVGQAQNQSTMGLGFSQRIPLTGGTVSVQSGISRIDLFGTQNTKYWQTTPLVLSLQQGLFKPRDILWQEREQSLGAIVAERGYLEAREDVAGTIAGAFFDLYAARMALDNAAANAAINDTLYTLNKGRYEVGKIGENDLLQSELLLLRAQAAVDDARLTRDRAEAALRRQIGLPEEEVFEIVTPDSLPSIEADPVTAVREALKNASAVEQNALDAVGADYEITQATLSNRFNATINASVGFNQTAPVFGQAYQSPLGAQTLAIGVNMPMLQWGAGREDVQAAKADARRVVANNKMRRDALVEDARFSALGLQQAYRAVVISAKADTVGEKRFAVAKERYVIGKISNTELYTGQADKDAAVLAYVQALRAYWVAYYHLRRATLYDFATNRELADEK